MEWIIVRTLLSLAAIVALMLGLAFLVRKYLHAGKGLRRSLVDVELLGHRSLQPRTAVYVLKVLNRVIVVGASEHGMQTLSEITDPDVLASVEESMTAGAAAPRWFPGVKVDGAGGAKSFSDFLTMSLRGAFFATKHTK
ncbi:MAG TPA: flagellar biosynthetic protein FliO [Bacteroidota bacterium]|nr:flagellar biosynthetic protein FliO [Bacteroidota bacterium]